jgi:hypothetical protein
MTSPIKINPMQDTKATIHKLGIGKDEFYFKGSISETDDILWIEIEEPLYSTSLGKLTDHDK